MFFGAEGLFDRERKLPLPFFPETIAIITSDTGAAIEDMLKIIREKNDYVDILIYPTLVQGPEAASQISDAIKWICDKRPETDLIITGRGGGSIQDLWAFNEEILARTIAASTIPVISAVGHETDVTISDFVSDKRAETPTAAANMAAPSTADIRSYIKELQESMDSKMAVKTDRLKMKLLDFGIDKLQSNIRLRLMEYEHKTKELKQQIAVAVKEQLDESITRLNGIYNTLKERNPKKIMERGYALISDSNDKIITSAGLLTPSMSVKAEFIDGRALMTVDEVLKQK